MYPAPPCPVWGEGLGSRALALCGVKGWVAESLRSAARSEGWVAQPSPL